MDSRYELVRYEPALKSAVMELQSLLWSPDAELNSAYFDWKYLRNPYIDEPLLYLAMHKGKLAGMRGFFGTRWEAGAPTQASTVPYADDLVIAPEHRNRGLIPRIMNAAFVDLARRSYEYVFNLSAGSVTFLSSLAIGWRSVPSMQPMNRAPLPGQNGLLARAAGKLKRMLSGQAAPSSPRLADITAAQARRRLRGCPNVMFAESPRCEAMAELVLRIGFDGRIRHVRDRQYLQWRFQNPLSRYRFLFLEQGRLEGYLVLQESTSEFADQQLVNIVDWEATTPDGQALLLRAALELVGDRKLSVWAGGLSSQEVAVLQQNGFLPESKPQSAARPGRAVLVRPIRDPGRNQEWLFARRPLLSSESWDLRMLYSMNG